MQTNNSSIYFKNNKNKPIYIRAHGPIIDNAELSSL